MTDAAKADISKRDIRKRRSLVAQTTLALFGRTGALLGLLWIGLTALLAFFAPFLANSRPITWLVQDETGAWVRQFPLFQFLTPQDVMLAVGVLLAAVLAIFYRAGGKLVWVWLIPMAATVVVSLIYNLEQEHSQLVKALSAAQAALDGVVDTAGTTKERLAAYQKAVAEASWQLSKWWVIWVSLGLGVLGLCVLAVARLRHDFKWLGIAVGLAVVFGCTLAIPSMRVDTPTDVAYDTYRSMLADGSAKGALHTLVPYSPDDLQVDAQIKPNTLGPGPSPSETDIAADMVSYVENKFDIRLYALDQEIGSDFVTPAPVTVQEANDAADRLWKAYQERNQNEPGYESDKAQALDAQVREGLIQLAENPIGQRYHAMGTTANGEDLSSRMIHGSRIALVIGFISTGIAVFIGIVVGGLLGYFAGWVDLIGLRLVEIFASIPVIMLLIMIVAFYGRSLILMMVVLGLTGWVGYAYFIRAEFLKLRKMDYVMAARAAGTPLHLILFKHMLPNGVAPVLVGASFGIAGAIMTEATLSFLGLGLENEPSWGQMLNQARQGGSFSWWLAIYPGAAIFLTVFAYNLIGEALRDVIDPRAVK